MSKMRLSKLAKWLLVLACFVALLISLWLFWLLQGFRVRIEACDKGPLSTIVECNIDHSTYTWMGSGWWYTHVKGSMTEKYCKKTGIDADSFDIQYRSTALQMPRIDCSKAGFISASNCFGIQWITSNGNSRNAILMAANDCKKSEFFIGAKAILIDGKGTHIEEWTTPYPGIPERN